MHIFFLGYPGNMGGANTECWHTAKLWRSAGIDVTFVPTWGRDEYWEDRLASIGCATVHAGNADNLVGVPGFRGSIVVAMCNSQAMQARGILKDLGCRLVWMNCMTFLFDNEIAAFRRHGPAEAYVFQSEFQRAELEKVLPTFGYRPAQGRVIRGALSFGELPFCPRPHRPPEEFYIGKLARPDLDKWSSNHWRILERVPYAGRRALAMGWTPPLTRKCGAAAGLGRDVRATTACHGRIPRPLPRLAGPQRRCAGELASRGPGSDGRWRAAGLPEPLGLAGDDRRMAKPASSPIVTRKWRSVWPSSPMMRNCGSGSSAVRGNTWGGLPIPRGLGGSGESCSKACNA